MFYLKNTTLFLIVLSLFLQGIVYPEEDNNPLLNRLQLQTDYARFPSDQDFTYIEVYYTFYRSQLKFIPQDQYLQANYQIQARIFSHDSLVGEDVIHGITSAENRDQIKPTQQLIDQSAFMIKSGHYRLEIRVIDMTSSHYGKKEFEIDIPELPPTPKIRISDIQTAKSITPNPNLSDKFTKNTYQIIPNPSAIYTSESPVLYFYTEIHDLVPADSQPNYRVIYSLLDSNYQLVRLLQDKVKKVSATSSVEINGFNLITHQSGIYYLKMVINDLKRHHQDSVFKRIILLRSQDKLPLARSNSGVESDGANLQAAEYLVYDEMDESILNEEIEVAALIATDTEKKTFKSLNSDGKRSFIKEFWLQRDNQSGTAINEYRQDFFERLKYVNQHYSNVSTNQPGWKSDRGRVYLIYGNPDELDRSANSSEQRAFEQWNYFELEGGISFIFVDIWGDGKYLLVHSTARNELHDVTWERWLEP